MKVKSKQKTARHIWLDDSIQFPRLLAEVYALGLDEKQINRLCASMDLLPGDIFNLFERAENNWEEIKLGAK